MVTDFVSRSWLRHFAQRLFRSLGMTFDGAKLAGVVQFTEQVASVELAFSVRFGGRLAELPVVVARAEAGGDWLKQLSTVVVAEVVVG